MRHLPTRHHLQMIQNIPALALIPLVILWFGIDETAKLFWLRSGSFPHLHQHLSRHTFSRSTTNWNGEKLWFDPLATLYKEIILPGAMPSILVGLRFHWVWYGLLLIVAKTISTKPASVIWPWMRVEFLSRLHRLKGIWLHAHGNWYVLAVTLEKYRCVLACRIPK